MYLSRIFLTRLSKDFIYKYNYDQLHYLYTQSSFIDEGIKPSEQLYLYNIYTCLEVFSLAKSLLMQLI